MRNGARGRVAAAGCIAVALAVTGCGSSSSSSRTSPPGGGSAPAASGGDAAVAVLGSIPDTVTYRSLIVADDVTALWRSVGLPATPTADEVLHTTVGQDLQDGVEFAGRLGPGAVISLDATSGPGYDPLTATVDVEAGASGDGVSYDAVPVAAAPVAAALHKVGATSHVVGGAEVFALGRVQAFLDPERYASLLAGLDDVAVPLRGGAVVGGSPGVPAATVAALATRAPVAHALGADPAVRSLVALWPHALSVVLGTSLVVPETEILGGRVPAAARAAVEADAGLARIPLEATFAGWSYLAGPAATPSVGAAVLYGSHAAAEAAVRTVGAFLRTGSSLSKKVPYARLLQVQRLDVDGDLVVGQLRLRSPGALQTLLASDDFPLFWTP